MRVEKNGIRYFSFAELPTSKSNNKTNKKQNEELKTKFEKRHTCKICKQPMTYLDGTNVCVCQNPDCKGKKVKVVLSDGTEKNEFRPYFHTLDEVGVSIATRIYAK